MGLYCWSLLLAAAMASKLFLARSLPFAVLEGRERKAKGFFGLR